MLITLARWESSVDSEKNPFMWRRGKSWRTEHSQVSSACLIIYTECLSLAICFSYLGLSIL